MMAYGIAVDAVVDDLTAMHEPLAQGDGRDLVAEDLGPVRKALVARLVRRGPFVAMGQKTGSRASSPGKLPYW